MSKGEVVLAKPLPPADLAAGVDAALGLWRVDLETAAPNTLRALREAAVKVLKSGQAGVMAAQLERPATRLQVAKALHDDLIEGWPQEKKNDLQIFTALMAEDVWELKASPLALTAACKALRAAKTFLPAIADVVAAVEAQKAACAARAALLARLPRRVVEADQILALPASGPP